MHSPRCHFIWKSGVDEQNVCARSGFRTMLLMVEKLKAMLSLAYGSFVAAVVGDVQFLIRTRSTLSWQRIRNNRSLNNRSITHGGVYHYHEALVMAGINLNVPSTTEE